MQPQTGPIAILAGSGQFPVLLAEALRRTGRPCRILAFRGFADAALRKQADVTVDLLDVKRTLACLSEWEPSAVTLAGGVRRPGPAAVLSAFSLLRNRRELMDLMARGDDRLLRGVIDLLEEHGHRVIGVHDLAPELLAEPGVQGVHRPSAEDERTIAVGMGLLRHISRYDVGQAAVLVDERVLAIEGPEGTDRMLARVRRLRRSWFFARTPVAGVLVKSPKQDQDLRVDLPAIGPLTAARAAKAGLRGIAVVSGATLILDRDKTVRAADRLGLFVVAVEPFGEPVAA
ncbi:MAG TPA: UDP-2,3-diacylglucosamine diphosphatase LpxI [Beijerinckiaceae bacterium]|nr:UDP-2,3-diacylglucosamine diphosphatase LpxI [Beijerinckiaceae bacterium]